MTFCEYWDWMYRRMICNVSVREREFMKEWWEKLGEMVDKSNKAEGDYQEKGGKRT